MANPGFHKYLLVAFALTLVNVDLLSAKAETQSAHRPDRNRSEGPSCRGLDSAAARRPIPAGERSQDRQSGACECARRHW